MPDRRPLPSLTIEQQQQPVVCALALIGEAWGEQDLGGNLEAASMLGVLWTAENRRTDPAGRWPRTLREVFLQPHQYSCFNADSPVRSRLLVAHGLDPVSWERADTVCDLFDVGLTLDPTRGATHFCHERLWARDYDIARTRPPWYSKQEIEIGRTIRLVQIGQHIFARAA